MITFGEKLGIALLVSFLSSITFSFLQVHVLVVVPPHFLPLIELLFFSAPFFFFLTETIDGPIGVLASLTYYVLKEVLLWYAVASPVCLFSILLFCLAFTFLSFAIAYQHEQSLKEAKLSFLGVVWILFAFTFGAFLLTTYHGMFEEILCLELPPLPFPFIPPFPRWFE